MRIKKMALLLLVLAFTTACGTSDWRVCGLIGKARERFEAEAPEIVDFTIEQEMTDSLGTLQSTSAVRIMAKGTLSRIDTRVLESEPPESPERGLTIYYQPESNSIVFDGESFWYVSAKGYNKAPPATGAGNRIKPKKAPQERNSLRDHLEFSFTSPHLGDGAARIVAGLWPEWLEPDSRFLGVEEVSGRPCYVVAMPPSTRTPCEKVWIDVETLHLAKAELGSAGSIFYSATFEDWREVAPGIWLPFSKVTIGTRDGRNELLLKQRIKSVEVNSSPSDDLFDPQKIVILDQSDRSESPK